MELDGYARWSMDGPCFICAFLAGEAGYEHELIAADGTHVTFLDRCPTLPGYTLVVPRRHLTDVVGDLERDEYLALRASRIGSRGR